MSTSILNPCMLRGYEAGRCRPCSACPCDCNLLTSCDTCAHALLRAISVRDAQSYVNAQEPGLDEHLQADAAISPAASRCGLLQGLNPAAGLHLRHAYPTASKGAPSDANTPAGARSSAATPARPASAGSMEEAATPWPPAGTDSESAGLGPSAGPEADAPAWRTHAAMQPPILPAATTVAQSGARQGAPGEGSCGIASEALTAPGPPGSPDLGALAQALLAQLAAVGALAGHTGTGLSPAAAGQARAPTPQHPSAQAHQWSGFAMGAAPGSAGCPGATHPGAYMPAYPAASAHWPWPGCMAQALPWAAPGLGTPELLRQPQLAAPQAQLPADSAALAAVLQSLLHALSLRAAASPAAAAATPTQGASPTAATSDAAASLQALLRALAPTGGSPAPAADAAGQPPSTRKPDGSTPRDPVPGESPSPDPGVERARRAVLRASAVERHARALRSIQSLIRQPNGAHVQASAGLGDATKRAPAQQRAGKGRDRQEPDAELAGDPRRYPAFLGSPGSGSGVGCSPLAKLPRSRSDASAQTAASARYCGDDGWAFTTGQSPGGLGSMSVGTRGAGTHARLQPGPESFRDPGAELREGHLAGLARRALARSLSSERGWPEAGGLAASPGPDAAVASPERGHQQPGAEERPVDVHFNPLFHSGEGEGFQGGSGAGSGDRCGAAGGTQGRREASGGPGQEPWQGPAAGATPLAGVLAAADVSEPLRRELLGLLERNLAEVQVRMSQGMCMQERDMHAKGNAQCGMTPAGQKGLMKRLCWLGLHSGPHVKTHARTTGLMPGPQHPHVTWQAMPPLISGRPLCCSPSMTRCMHTGLIPAKHAGWDRLRRAGTPPHTHSLRPLSRAAVRRRMQAGVGPAWVAARGGARTLRTCWRPRSCCWRASRWRASASSHELHCACSWQ